MQPFDLAPVQIPLTKGHVALVDPCDMDLLDYKWLATGKPERPYAGRATPRVEGKQGREWMHRVVLERKLNRKLSASEEADHIDGNSLNNCRSNLRPVSRSQNLWNSKRHKNNRSGLKGVCFDVSNQSWKAQIAVGGKVLHLGSFETRELAHSAYLKAAQEYHGEYARTE